MDESTPCPARPSTARRGSTRRLTRPAADELRSGPARSAPATGWPLSLSVSLREDGPDRCPLTLDLYRTDGAIDTVVLYTEKDTP